MAIKFKLNGEEIEKNVIKTKPLVDFLRDDMGLTSVKKGCEVGECGACTVLLNKKAVNSCMVMTGQIDGLEVITIEGLNDKVLMTLQERMMSAGAVQCGYCTPGMIMAILGLLYKNIQPSKEEIIRAIDGNLCRCTGYRQIIESVESLKLEDIAQSLNI